MLADVQVNTEQQSLWVPSAVGGISLELHGVAPGADEGEEPRFDFYSPLSSGSDPNAANNPGLTQQYPYSILPDGAEYQAVIRAPIGMVDTEWSDGERVDVEPPWSFEGLGNIEKGEFEIMYPGVDVSSIEDGLHNVTAQERTKPTLLVMGRVASGEPLSRMHSKGRSGEVYREVPIGAFARDTQQSGSAVARINSRRTVDEGSSVGYERPLRFEAGTANLGGLLELIIVKATLVEHTEFEFRPHAAGATPQDESHTRVEARGILSRREMKPVAAFRVSLVEG